MLLTLHLVVQSEQFDEIARCDLVEVFRSVHPYWSLRITRKKFARVLVVCGANRDKTLEFPWQGYDIKRIGLTTYIEMTGLAPMSSASMLKVFAIHISGRALQPQDRQS